MTRWQRWVIVATAVGGGATWLLGSPDRALADREARPPVAQPVERLPAAAVLAKLGAGAREIVVSSTAEPRTVAAAIAGARDGDRILVKSGVYREPTIIVDRSVEIVGEGWPVLDGEGDREIMVVTGRDVSIRGLRFRNVGKSMLEDRAAIRVAGTSGCTIEGNIVEDAFFGVYLHKSERCIVSRNLMSARGTSESSSGNGVHSYSSRDVSILDNDIRGFRDGIYLEFSRDARVFDNRSIGNIRYGLHFMYSDSSEYRRNTFADNNAGVAVMYSHWVEMSGNEFRDHRGSASYGLLLKEVYDARLVGNRFDRNTVALFADGAGRIVADGNVFSRNGWAVKLMASTTDGRFSRNDFKGNTFDVSTNSRQSANAFSGNYWDEYVGYDLDRDGTGDVPHRPVRLFSLIVEENAPALIVLRSLFVSMLDRAERVIPSITPQTLLDDSPAMRALQ
jgi:nitrous oxidase accessory protein